MTMARRKENHHRGRNGQNECLDQIQKITPCELGEALTVDIFSWT